MLEALSHSLSRVCLTALSLARGFHFTPRTYLSRAMEMVFGRYEESNARLFDALIRPGDTVVEVGANIGYFTRRYARLAGPRGRVLAFEPNPVVLPILRKNVRGRPWVSVHPCGLADVRSRLPFYSGSNTAVASSSREYTARYTADGSGNSVREYEIEVMPGDVALAEAGVAGVSFIKIDVEGMEIDVLRGLEHTLRSNPELVVFCEFNPSALHYRGASPEDLLQVLLGLGFTPNLVHRGSLEPITTTNLQEVCAAFAQAGYADLISYRERAARLSLETLRETISGR